MTLTQDPQIQDRLAKRLFPRLRTVAIAFLLLGVVLRVVFLEQEFFWGDEVLTALRISGYSEVTVIDQLYQGQALQLQDLQVYQQPQARPGWGAVWAVLTDHPEHPPLYYVLNRIWTRLVGLWSDRPVPNVRSLSIVFSLATLPLTFAWLRQCFSHRVAWMAIALMAVSPLHVLYAQEARQYSLWMLLMVASNWAVMRAVEQSTRTRWGLYALTATLGLYTHLLFGLVLICQGLYVVASQGWRTGAIFRRYGQAIALALLAFSPWLWVIVTRFEGLQHTVQQAQNSRTVVNLVQDLSRLINRVFFNADLTWANGILVLLIGVVVYQLWRRSPIPGTVLIVSLIVVPFMVLAIPDLITGSAQSARVRYMIPAYLGIQWAIALQCSQGIYTQQRWQRSLWRFSWSLLLVGSVSGSLVGVYQTDVPWINGGKVRDYLAIAEVINAQDAPRIVSDTRPVRAIALSYRLKPEATLQLFPPSADQLAELTPSRLRDRTLAPVSTGGMNLEAMERGTAWVVDPSPGFQTQLASLGRLTMQYEGRHMQLWEWRRR
ncbi:glycosyltransferase family 39 protein [Leptolyngbya sp. CCY15150]|uniref:glycosyltransferase family 39 protein n=1 Tax=Leptolyngbya sp. CCY15150 TaxID=2767772 RepID=UPI0019521C82|nr:glycosyltransferase family 39 protein [Leptolyngbya sp. CCY15150]